MEALGKHLLIELYNCDKHNITDAKTVEEIMVGAAKATEATIVSTSFHTFNPFGVSGVVVIAESHLAIHTWPEYNFASIDVYTCGDTVKPWKAYEYLKKHFKSKKASFTEIKRGIIDPKEFGQEHLQVKQTSDKQISI